MGLLNNIQRIRAHQRAANHLHTLSDRALADIGTTRKKIDEYVSKNLNQ